MAVPSSLLFEVDPRANPRPSESKTLAALRKPVEKWIVPIESTLEWSAVIGNDRAKTELRDVIEARTKNADLFAFYDLKLPKGMLLVGPPGCGKTYLAKALTAEFARTYKKERAELLLINGASIESPILSIAGNRIDAVFDYAAEYQKVNGHPLIIFIDEADALLCDRERSPVSTEVVSAFLARMDGLTTSGAFVLLASNRPDYIDQAVLRDGRIDLKCKVQRPTYDNVKDLLRLSINSHAAWMKNPIDVEAIADELWSADYKLEELVNPKSKAVHFFMLQHIVNGAMVAGLTDRAKRRAFRRDREQGTLTGVLQEDLIAAVAEVFEENKDLQHTYAKEEFVKEVAIPAEEEREKLK